VGIENKCVFLTVFSCLVLSSPLKSVPIECIKEIRIGSDGRYYRQQFQLADEYENRWITIVYILDGNYKTLHLIAETERDFEMWRTSLKKLHTIRQELMSGLAPLEMKQAIWEKQYWKVADEEADQKLEFEEAEKLCKRLNVNTPTDELRRLFNARSFALFSELIGSNYNSSKRTGASAVTSTSAISGSLSNC
jgi:phosphatidylinositol phospholipase C delta